MKTKVVITVDTEPSVAGAFADSVRYKPLIHEPVWGESGGKSQALGFMLDTLTRYKLHGTFFVETAHRSYFSEKIMGEYARKICDAGQDVQLHLHPCWLSFEAGWREGDTPFSDQCCELTEDQLISIINSGCAQIAEWTGKKPYCMRTGNFSVSKSVYRAMNAAGLKVASNICVAVAPPSTDTADQWGGLPGLAGGLHNLEGVMELPVACFKDYGPVGRGNMRGLQVTACSFAEQRKYLFDLHEANAPIAVIVTHPFEFLQWSGPDYSNLRANRLVQRRFERLCAFLAENDDCFDVVPICHFAEEELSNEPAVELEGNAILGTGRAVTNFLNDRLFSIVKNRG